MRVTRGRLGVILLLLSIVSTANAQSKQSASKPGAAQGQSASEISKLRDEYIKATKEYKASLERLLALYQASARKAELRAAQTRKLLADGLVTEREVDQSQSALRDANLKVTGAQQQIASADTQIEQTLAEIRKPENTAKLAREYKQASTRQPSCRNWTMTASRHQRGRKVTIDFRVVCHD